jgi:hypothetical protein
VADDGALAGQLSGLGQELGPVAVDLAQPVQEQDAGVAVPAQVTAGPDEVGVNGLTMSDAGGAGPKSAETPRSGRNPESSGCDSY